MKGKKIRSGGEASEHGGRVRGWRGRNKKYTGGREGGGGPQWRRR